MLSGNIFCGKIILLERSFFTGRRNSKVKQAERGIAANHHGSILNKKWFSVLEP
jgi:hypothetical protein